MDWIHHSIQDQINHSFQEQTKLECLHSENIPRCPMITYTSDSYQIPSQNNTQHTL